MSRHLLLLLPCFLGLAVPALAEGAATQPGQYRVTTVLPGARTPTIRYECFEAGAAEMFSLPEPAQGTRCTTTRNSLAGGRIDIARDCTDAQGRTSSGSVTGTHTATGFTMQARISGQALTAPVEVRAVGERVAAVCVAD